MTQHDAIRSKGSAVVKKSIILNLSLAAIKSIAGFFGNSYALIADGIESLTDVFSSLLTYIGIHLSTKPPDANHPFGHGKIEPLSAVCIGSSLFFAAGIISIQSIHEILTPHTTPEVWTIAVLLFVIITKEAFSRYAKNVGESLGSLTVQGESLHHRSDAVTSAAVFLGITVAIIGGHLSPDPRWSSADDWAALIASGAIVYNGWSIIKKALYELTDARPDAIIEKRVRTIALSVNDVLGLDKCFIRKLGFDYYVELDVRVDENLSVAEGHAIAHAVQNQIKEQIKELRIAKVLVHIEPYLSDQEKDICDN
jgi:cation diffusion facilitator family transporter